MQSLAARSALIFSHASLESTVGTPLFWCPWMCQNWILHVSWSCIHLHTISRSECTVNGSIVFLLLSQSNTDLPLQATAALLLNVLWLPMFPGATMDPSILFVTLAPSIIHAHVPHQLWNNPSDTASAVPPVIASLICVASPHIFNFSCHLVPSVVCSTWVYHGSRVVDLAYANPHEKYFCSLWCHVSAACGMILCWLPPLQLCGMLGNGIVLDTSHVCYFCICSMV